MTPSPGRPKTTVTVEQVLAEKKLGHSTKWIAAKYSVSEDTVERRIKVAKKSSAFKEKKSAGKPPAKAETSGKPKEVATVVAHLTELGEDINAPWLVSFANDNGQYQYHFNKQSDRYITWMKNHPQGRVVVPGDTHRNICQKYSNWIGKPAAINEMCREFGWPRSVMIEYLKIHGFTHDREPFSNEELLDGDTPVMIKDLLQRRRFDLHQQYEREKWGEIKADAAKWLNVEYHFLRVCREAMIEQAADYRPPLLQMTKSDSPYAAVLGLMDVHVGKGVWKLSDGTVLYDMKLVREYVLDCVQRLLQRLARNGRPDKIYLPVGSDFFHIDNKQGTTSNGTPQDMAASPELIIKFGCRLMVEIVDLCRQMAPVELVLCRGNHDEFSSLWLLLFLQAKYEDKPDVIIHEPEGPRQFLEYGNNIVGFEHGDGARKSDLPKLMATEARAMWGRTQHRTYYTGHFHGELQEEDGGILHRQFESLTPADRWHASKGFCLNRQAMTAEMIDHKDGYCGAATVLAQTDNSYGIKVKYRKAA